MIEGLKTSLTFAEESLVSAHKEIEYLSRQNEKLEEELRAKDSQLYALNDSLMGRDNDIIRLMTE